MAVRVEVPPSRSPRAPSSAAAPADEGHTPGDGMWRVSDDDKKWITVVGLSAMAAMICSVDRAAISVAILPMSEEFHWSDSTKGAINSAFYVGYTITNLVGGWLASTLSAKRVLGSGVVLWSLFTMTTPLAASGALPVLLANRAVMGAGEGVTFPSVQNLVKGWVPADSRSRALTLIYSGGQVGTILALVTAPVIINTMGWPAVFYIFGGSGLLWTLAWQPLVADYPPLLRLPPPADDASGNGVSGNGVSGNGVSGGGGALAPSKSMRLQDLPWRLFFTNKPFLAVLMAHASFGVGHYVCLSWLPTYYNFEFGVDVQQSALLSVLPWFVTVLVSGSSGWLADWLANSGTLTMTQTRKLLQGVGALGPAACLLYLAAGSQVDEVRLDMGQAVLLLTATLSLGGFQSAGFASNHQDLSTRYPAVLFGMSNALSSLMGTFSVYATGLILDATGSWSLVFELLAGFYIAGALGYLAWGSAEQQFE